MTYSINLYQSRHNFITGLRVEDALLKFDESRFDRISVTAFCGIVELSGMVSNYFDKLLAIKIAKRVAGVSTVVESIQIRPQIEIQRAKADRPRKPGHVYFTTTNHRATMMGRTN